MLLPSSHGSEGIWTHATRGGNIRSTSDILAGVRVTERPFSDLLRHPNDVAGDLEEGDVVLRRRDEPDLWLSRADREEARAEAFAAVTRAFRNLAVHSPDALAAALGEAFSWTEFLPVRDRRRFVEEFSRVVTAAAELDNVAPLTQLLREWRATAEVHADPALARRLRRKLEAAGGPVALPDS